MVASPSPPRVGAVVVRFGDEGQVEQAVASLRSQKAPPLDLFVVDNGGGAPLSEVPGARVLAPGRNLGFGGGVEHAAAAVDAEWLFVLNPDAQAEPECLARLLAATDDSVAVAGAQVLLPDGTVNAGDNPVHVTGLSWAGRLGQAAEDGPPRDVACVSGAAWLIRVADLRALGGFCPAMLAYHEDVDLCWRARLAGRRVVFVPGARVTHDWSFARGDWKWEQLEHNRAWTVLSNLAPRSLVALSPLLAGVELAIAAAAWRQGWLPAKRRAWRAVWAQRAALRRWRSRVQARRRAGDDAILRQHVWTIDTPALGGPLVRLANLLLAPLGRLAR